MTGLNGLKLAVPRGTLFGEVLDLLDRLGAGTAEVRSNERRLLFEDAGIVTMRPSDVPTYVEAGAADIGITGKDVLAEQSERAVYELLDLRFGPCVMVVATIAGEDRLAEALRRLGVMRVATKYPKVAARHFERTGRQAEIVEVKGSVELAPLTGLAEGIVDLTATGATLRENGLVVREEILSSTARLIANPVAHKLKAAAIDDLVARMRVVVEATAARGPDAGAGGAAAVSGSDDAGAGGAAAAGGSDDAGAGGAAAAGGSDDAGAGGVAAAGGSDDAGVGGVAAVSGSDDAGVGGVAAVSGSDDAGAGGTAAGGAGS